MIACLEKVFFDKTTAMGPKYPKYFDPVPLESMAFVMAAVSVVYSFGR